MPTKSPIEDENLSKKFLYYIKRGNHEKIACKLSGLPISSLNYAKTKAKEAKEKEDYGNKYYIFIRKLEMAECFTEDKMVGVVTDSAYAGDPKAAEWYLEHKCGDRWKKESNVNIGKDNSIEVKFVSKKSESEDNGKSGVGTKRKADSPHE